MNIKNIMTKKIISVEKNDTLKNTALIMLKNQIGFLPVFDNDELVGCITDRDITIKGCTTLNTDDKIESIISNEVITVDIDDDIDKVLKTMSKYKVTRILVKKQHQIVGIISLSDLLTIDNIDKDIIKTLKTIKEIKPNTKEKEAKIDDFEL